MSKKKPCSRMGCGALVPIRQSYCEKHKVIGWYKRSDDQRKAHTQIYGAEWRKARAAALTRDRYICKVCEAAGRIRTATAVDHIVPTSQGGTHDMQNLQSICGSCHQEKTQSEKHYAKQ